MSHPMARCLAKSGAGSILPPLLHCEETKVFNLLEVWTEIGNPACKSRTSSVDAADLRRRMRNEVVECRSYIIRLVYIPLIRHSTRVYLDLQARQFEDIIDVFGLHDVRRLAHTSPMTFDVIPQLQDESLVGFEWSVFISRFFGLYLTSHAPSSNCAIVWGDKQMTECLVTAIIDLIGSVQHLSLIPLATIITLTSHVDDRLTQIHVDILTIEERTGHHHWGETTTVAAAQGSLPSLSAMASGRATLLASDRRMTKLCCEMLAGFGKPAQRETPGILSAVPGSHIDATVVAILDQRFRNQLLQLDLMEARVRIQLTALFNLVTSQETNQNMEIAKDSKTIANATRRDSSSMKILAAVTVFFLPATFIASLFSTSMFNWNADNASVVSPRFWIYWATVIPLTLMTMAACFVLSQRWAMVARSEDENVLNHLGKPLYK